MILKSAVVFKKYNCVLIFMSISFCAFAQINEEERAIEVIIDSAYDKFNKLDLTSSIRFSNQALQQSDNINYEKGIAWSSFYIGQSLFELVKYHEALEYLKNAEHTTYSKSDFHLTFEICRVRSRIYGNMRLFEKSVQEQLKGLSYIPKIEKPLIEKKYLTSLAYDNIANTYRLANNSDSSFYYLQKNADLLHGMEEEFVFPNLVNLYTGLGDYYTREKKPALALNYFKKSEETALKYGYNYLSYNFMKWGDLELSLHNYDDAFLLYQKSLDNLKENPYRHLLPDLYNRLAICIILTTGDIERANTYKLKALELQNEKKNESIQTSEYVMKILLEKNRSSDKQKYFQNLMAYAGLFILFTVIGIYFYRKKLKNIKHSRTRSEEQISELEKKVNESYEKIIKMANDNHPDFYTRFQEVYPELNTVLLMNNNKLTISELTLAAYIYLGFSTKEIAELTFRSIKTIETTRYNLRKKLNLSSEVNLQSWLMSLT